MKGSKKGVFSEFLLSPSLGSGSVKGGQFSVTIGGHFSMTFDSCVNLCIKLTENASDASVFSVSLKRSFLTQVYPQIYFHSVPADKSRIPGIGKYCNTATAVSAVFFELDTNTNFEVKRISHKRRKCSGFILTATKVRFCITDTVHFDWNQCSNCRNQCSNYWNQCSFILEYALKVFTAGRFVRKKGFDFLLKAIPEVLAGDCRTQFQIAGDGPEFDELKLEDKVQFLGFRNEG